MTASSTNVSDSRHSAERHRLSLGTLLTIYLVVMFLGAAMVPGLPIATAIASLFTRLRSHLWIQIAIWLIAILLSVLQVLPFLKPSVSVL